MLLLNPTAHIQVLQDKLDIHNDKSTSHIRNQVKPSGASTKKVRHKRPTNSKLIPHPYPLRNTQHI